MKRIIMVTTLALVAACGGGGGTASPTPSAAARISSTAELAVIEPKTGQTYTPDRVPVKLSLKGARLLDEVTTTVTPDTGHIHVLLDGKTIYVASGLELSFDLVEVKNSEQSQDKTPLSPGPHLLQFEFVDARHLPFDPRVLTAVHIMVR